MKTFSINEALNYGWALFKQNKKVLALAALVYLVITNAQNMDMAFPELPTVLEYAIVALFGLLSILVQIGWYKMLLKVMDGVPVKIGELFAHTRLFFRYIGALILYIIVTGIPVLVGSILWWFVMSSGHVWLAVVVGAACVAAGIASVYLALKYHFVLVLVIDKEEMGIREAFKVSAKMTEGVKWKLVGLCFMTLLLIILGAIVFVVGVLATFPTAILAYLSIYRKLLALETPSV